MTLAFFTGLLAGMAIAWIWYVVASWVGSKPEPLELVCSDPHCSCSTIVYRTRIP